MPKLECWKKTEMPSSGSNGQEGGGAAVVPGIQPKEVVSVLAIYSLFVIQHSLQFGYCIQYWEKVTAESQIACYPARCKEEALLLDHSKFLNLMVPEESEELALLLLLWHVYLASKRWYHLFILRVSL